MIFRTKLQRTGFKRYLIFSAQNFRKKVSDHITIVLINLTKTYLKAVNQNHSENVLPWLGFLGFTVAKTKKFTQKNNF